jgi:hypothetical protein
VRAVCWTFRIARKNQIAADDVARVHMNCIRIHECLPPA